MRVRKIIAVAGACMALGAVGVTAQGSPADAAVVHRETAASCERAFIARIDAGRPVRWAWHHDCQLLTSGQRDRAWNLANRATS